MGVGRKRSQRGARPPPVAGVEAAQARIMAALANRTDRFSQLLARAVRSEMRGQILVTTTSPLTDSEFKELAGLTPLAHEDFAGELATATERLRGLLAAGDPLYIMAVVQDLNMLMPFGEYYEPTNEGLETRVELVAGLLATLTAAPAHGRPTAADMQAILDEIDHILLVNLLFNVTRSPAGGMAEASLRFYSANRWMSLRGTSFAGHAEDLALEMYRGQEQWMTKALGYTVPDLIRVGRAVTALHTDRRNALGWAGASAASAELLAAKGASRADQREAMGRALIAMLSTTEEGLRDAVAVTTDSICGQDPALDPARVDTILRDLSVSIGSVDPASYRGLLHVNPLRERPFLEHDGAYLLALPGALSRDIDTLMESRVLAARSGFSRQRAAALDRLAVGYLAAAVPGATTHLNLRYGEFELDGLVTFERTAFVVEGKASRISPAGQRGDLDRLRADMERAVEDAWEQGARARDYLLRAEDAVFADDRGREVLRVPAGHVREVIIVNPTLHEMAGLAQQLPRLRSLGMFKAGEYPWSIYINDLRVIVETCENAAVFLHYLTWRDRLPLGDRLIAFDEIDLWGAYLLAERFGGLSGDGHMTLGNCSTDFDAYYDGLAGRGPRRDPPRKFLPDSARTFVTWAATARPPGWREAAGVVLDLSLAELAFLDVHLPEVASAAATGQPVGMCVGRVLLVGLGNGTNASVALTLFDAGASDPTFAIACRLGLTGKPEIVWAQYRKAVTFELSAFEEAASLAGSRAIGRAYDWRIGGT